MHVGQIKEPLPENRLLSKIRNPNPTAPQGRRVNACGAGDGTGPPSRRCAPSHTGRLSCVTDDTAHRGQITRPLRDSANLHACVTVRVACWLRKAGNTRILSTYAKSDLHIGERRQPARKHEHQSLSSCLSVCKILFTFEGKCKVSTFTHNSAECVNGV